MARLRSAARAVAATDPPSSLGTITAEQMNQSTASPVQKSVTAKTKTKLPRSKMPVPATPSSRTISYPSLDAIDSPAKKPQDLYPVLDSSGAKTPTTSIPLPASVTTTRKAMPGAFEISDGGGNASDFTFNFSPGLGEYGRKMLDEIKDKARDIRAQMETDPTTPGRQIQSPTKQQAVATTGRCKRFSDIHKEQFAKMESIADHYAAKRKVTTPQNPQKGVKRTQSQATLDEKSLPPTPSPVKKQPDKELELKTAEGRRSKRSKIEPVSSFASRIEDATGTPRRSTKPPPSAARTAVSRRVSAQRKPLTALPRYSGIEPSVRLVPTPVNGTPSRIPVTPSSKGGLMKIAPATVSAVPKFNLSKIPQPGTPRAVGGASSNSPQKLARPPMSEAKPRAIRQLRKMGDMTSKGPDNMSSPRMGVLSPIKLTETVDLEDPFGGTDRIQRTSKDWAFKAPDGNPSMPEFPKVPTHEFTSVGSERGKQVGLAPQGAAPSTPPPVSSKKRKEMDTAPEETGRDEPVCASSSSANDAEGEKSPARKKLRFDGINEGIKDMKDNVMGKGRALLNKARLEFLATPKRKIDRLRGSMTTTKKRGKPLWK